MMQELKSNLYSLDMPASSIHCDPDTPMTGPDLLSQAAFSDPVNS